jgi:membrane protein
MYKFIPSGKVSMKFSATSALIGGILVMTARWIFSWYLTSLSNYGAFYGTYAAIVSIAIWVYYFSFILLFSVEISNLIHKKKTI